MRLCYEAKSSICTTHCWWLSVAYYLKDSAGSNGMCRVLFSMHQSNHFHPRRTFSDNTGPLIRWNPRLGSWIAMHTEPCIHDYGTPTNKMCQLLTVNDQGTHPIDLKIKITTIQLCRYHYRCVLVCSVMLTWSFFVLPLSVSIQIAMKKHRVLSCNCDADGIQSKGK